MHALDTEQQAAGRPNPLPGSTPPRSGHRQQDAQDPALEDDDDDDEDEEQDDFEEED